jgi:hypothetical protein
MKERAEMPSYLRGKMSYAKLGIESPNKSRREK